MIQRVVRKCHTASWILLIHRGSIRGWTILRLIIDVQNFIRPLILAFSRWLEEGGELLSVALLLIVAVRALMALTIHLVALFPLSRLCNGLQLYLQLIITLKWIAVVIIDIGHLIIHLIPLEYNYYLGGLSNNFGRFLYKNSGKFMY